MPTASGNTCRGQSDVCRAGHAATFPKYASPACKHGRTTTSRETEPVGLLVRAYLGNKLPALEKLMQDEQAFIRAENLTGLVGQMRDQMITHAIRKMTATYMTLPLAAVAAEAGLQSAAEASKHVFKCVPHSHFSHICLWRVKLRVWEDICRP